MEKLVGAFNKFGKIASILGNIRNTLNAEDTDALKSLPNHTLDKIYAMSQAEKTRDEELLKTIASINEKVMSFEGLLITLIKELQGSQDYDTQEASV